MSSILITPLNLIHVFIFSHIVPFLKRKVFKQGKVKEILVSTSCK